MATLWRRWTSRPLGELIDEAVRRWWRSLAKPDPWSDELDAAVRASDAVPICRRCTTPCELPVWFCPVCGTAVGPYNNVLPYVRIFSHGEALRSGVGPEAHFTPFRRLAYIMVGLAEYSLFAPLYIFRLERNRLRMERDQD